MATTWGAIGTIGYHLVSGKVTIDPIVTLAATHTHIADIALPAVSSALVFQDNNTVRGAVGARIGTTLADGPSGRLHASVTGQYWDQFSGNDQVVSINNPGQPFDLAHSINGKFGEAAGELAWTSGTTTAWLHAGAKFNQTYSAFSANVGIRIAL